MLYSCKKRLQETAIAISLAESQRAGRILTRDFLFLLTGAFSFYASIWIVMLSLPPYVLALGGSEADVGLVLSAFAFTALLSRPAVGRAIDSFGPRPVALVGCFIFASAPVLYPAAPSILALIAIRMYHGLGIACFGTAGMTWVADLAPATRRAEMMGLYSNTSQVAIALGPLLGALILGATGYGVLFAISAGAGIVSIVVVSRARQQQGRRGMVSGGGGFGQALARRDVLSMTFALMTSAATWGILMGFLPIYVTERQFGATAPFFTIYAVVTITLRLVVGPMADRVGRRIIAAPALLVLAATMIAFNAVHSAPALYALAVLYAVSFGMLFPMLSAYLVDVAPPNVRGSAIGVLTAGFDLGIMVGSYGGGVVAEHVGLTAAFTAAGVLCLIGVAVFWLGTPAEKRVQPAG